jgi:hypothetical protein
MKQRIPYGPAFSTAEQRDRNDEAGHRSNTPRASVPHDVKVGLPDNINGYFWNDLQRLISHRAGES